MEQDDDIVAIREKMQLLLLENHKLKNENLQFQKEKLSIPDDQPFAEISSTIIVSNKKFKFKEAMVSALILTNV